MSLTRRELQDLHREELHQLHLARPAPRRGRREWLTEQGVVATRWAVGIGLAWYATLLGVQATTPAPAHPGALAGWEVGLQVVLFGVIAAMAFGLMRRSRAGLLGSVGAGLLLLGLAVACPVSGHHEHVGAWWFAQLGAFTALTGASLAGLRRTSTA